MDVSEPSAGTPQAPEASPELTVVMPVYNEEAAIRATLEAWVRELERLDIDYELRLYDDGSRDRTPERLDQLAAHSERIRVIHQPNAGHGPTILRGYLETRGEWIFQTDSDGEIGPEGFATLWRHRRDFDFLLGFRQGRKASLARRLMTAGARGAIRLRFGRTAEGKTVQDVNTPFRLMRREPLLPLLEQVPTTTFAPNVALSGLAAAHGLRIFETPVRSRERAGGETSLQRFKLLRAALQSMSETVAIARRAKARRRAH